MSGAVFVVGQRWASHADPDLGLGIITEVAWRRVNVSWPAVGETRTYATDGAACKCGGRGCLETYASGTAIAAYVKALPAIP